MRSAAILVGGIARRLGGRPKHMLEVGNRPIWARQLDALETAGMDHFVMVGHTALPLPGAFHPVADAIADAGALGGLYTALLSSPGDRVLVLAGDLPFLSATFLNRLWETDVEADAVVPRTARGWHPLTAVYHRRIAARVKARIDRRALKITEALDELAVRAIEPGEVAGFDPDGVLLLNVNTPDDYERACRHAGTRENWSAGARRAKVDDSARM